MFCYAGRCDDMLKVGGRQVFTREIEDVIASHSAVEEVAVVGVEDATRGLVARAFVVSVKGALVSSGDIRQYCAEKLASYKVPRIIDFVSDLPRTESGKVRYGTLRSTVVSGRDI
jgi:acyl-coenzyme A synthetase/AMP-(fatty) acid ligase